MTCKSGTMLRQDLLLTLAEELDDLSTAATSVQATLGTIIERTGSDAGGVWHLQEIDRLQQTLDDLAAILRQAAGGEDAAINIEEVVAVTRLGALRDRLCGRNVPLDRDRGAVALF